MLLVQEISDIGNCQFKILSQITVVCSLYYMVLYMIYRFCQFVRIGNRNDGISVTVYQENIFSEFFYLFIRFLIPYIYKIPVSKPEPQQAVGFRNFFRRVKHSMDIIIKAECRID